MRSNLRIVLPGLLLVAALPAMNSSLPDWAQEASTRPFPPLPAGTRALVLLNEEHVILDAAGKLTTSYRRAVKILNGEGRKEAVAAVPYFSRNGKVKDLHAWLVTPTGFVKYYGKEKGIDIGGFSEELYNETRVRSIDPTMPDIGSVFAYEAETEAKTIITQDEFSFQRDLPVLKSRYVLTLPAGWTALSKLLNHAAIDPVVEGSTWSWTLTDLPVHHSEAHGPIVSSSVPRLCITFVPPIGPAIQSWADASMWLTELMAGQDDVNVAMIAKVKQLGATAESEYAKICVIARYVQQIKYVSVQMNLAAGGGYKPHLASTVFQKQYGDCKDKANLMRALLKAAGIVSYPVTLYTPAIGRMFVKNGYPPSNSITPYSRSL